MLSLFSASTLQWFTASSTTELRRLDGSLDSGRSRPEYSTVVRITGSSGVFLLGRLASCESGTSTVRDFLLEPFFPPEGVSLSSDCLGVSETERGGEGGRGGEGRGGEGGRDERESSIADAS